MMRFRTQLELNEWWQAKPGEHRQTGFVACRCCVSSRTRRRKLSSKLENSNNGADREENCVRAMRGRELAAELHRVEWGGHVAHNFNPIVAGAAGVAIPRAIEHICRVAVDVSPRVRSVLKVSW